jgi:hypothetical protein
MAHRPCGPKREKSTPGMKLMSSYMALAVESLSGMSLRFHPPVSLGPSQNGGQCEATTRMDLGGAFWMQLAHISGTLLPWRVFRRWRRSGPQSAAAYPSVYIRGAWMVPPFIGLRVRVPQLCCVSELLHGAQWDELALPPCIDRFG